MSAPRLPGFGPELAGQVLELTGWDAVDDLFSGADKARTFELQLEHASLYRQCFQTDAGRRVLEDLFELFLRRRIAVPGDPPLTVGIRQGQADVVMRILAMIDFANRGGGLPTGPGASPAPAEE